MLIKVVLKKRYVRVEKAENGRYIPVQEGPYEPGNYYLRYTLNGKRKWASVGGDLTIALQEQQARQASLELVPSASVATLPTRKTVAEAVKKFIANKNGEDRHAQRRARSWKWLLDLFSNWWDKTYIDEFTREDFQAFQEYLAKKGRQPRTQYNLLRSLVTSFRASGRVVLFARDEQEATILAATVVVKNTLILMSADMPKFTKCKVTPYAEEQQATALPSSSHERYRYEDGKDHSVFSKVAGHRPRKFDFRSQEMRRCPHVHRRLVQCGQKRLPRSPAHRE